MKDQKLTKKSNPPLFVKAPCDMLFLVLVLLLLVIGLIMMFSASFASAFIRHNDSYFYIKKQLIWAVVGVALMMLASRVNYNYLRLLAIPVYAISVILLILVMIMPSEAGGAGRWLNIGFRFQPSEVSKFAVILLMSLYIAKNYTKMKKFKNGFAIPLAIFLVAAALVVIEPHLSGAVLITAIGLSLMIVGGSSWKYMLPMFGTVFIGALGIIFGTDYMKARIDTWLDPAADPLGKGFQTLQSLYAIGSGGLFGLGIGRSRQKYLYIPEPQNDFIFAIVCEELGFIGAVIIICLFILLCYRGFVIAWSAPDKFGCLLVIGIIMQVAVQTVLNIAVVTNTMPVTGISLPFFSYGGTSLVLLLAQMGVVLSVSRQANLKKD